MSHTLLFSQNVHTEQQEGFSNDMGTPGVIKKNRFCLRTGFGVFIP
ncbi:hypothetical protein C2W63_02612 [Bacillus velezensis]|nr:hypothetical protein HS9_02342 [Bacillus velezensis]RAP18435.1 hypothetical protein C2W63_02612 [Bacillus velezensis]